MALRNEAEKNLIEIKKRLTKIERKFGKNIPLPEGLGPELKKGFDKILNIFNQTLKESLENGFGEPVKKRSKPKSNQTKIKPNKSQKKKIN